MDKLKEIRDNNPVADFAAGFIPGVGEAQDLHDLYHSVKDKDYKKAGFFALGLLIPGLSAGQLIDIVKKFTKPLGDLSPALKSKGWKLADDGESFIKDGISYVKNKDGLLIPEERLAEQIIDSPEYKKLLTRNKTKTIESAYKTSIKESVLDSKWNPEQIMKQRFNSEKLIPTKEELLEFKARVPEYIALEKELIKKGDLVKSQQGIWYGKFGKNWQEVIPEQYVMSKSKEFIDNGWVMSRKIYQSGMSDKYLARWKDNTLGFQKWFAENNHVAEGGNLAKSYTRSITGLSGTGDILGGHIAYKIQPGKTKNRKFEGYERTWANLPYDKSGNFSSNQTTSTRDLVAITQAKDGNFARTYFNNYEDGGVQWYPNSKQKRYYYYYDNPKTKKLIKKARRPVTNDNVLVLTPHTQIKLMGGNTGAFNPDHLGAFNKKGGTLNTIV